MTMKTSKKQKQIATAFLTDANYIFMDGAVRTGKSLFGCYSFVDGTVLYTTKPIYNNDHDNQHIVMGATFRNIRETLEPYILDKYRSMGIYPALTQFGMWAIVNGVTIKILYFGANDKGSIKAVQGVTGRSTFNDEVPTLNRATFEMGLSRCITYDDAKHYCTSNPAGGASHWYKEQYIDNVKLNKKVIHMTMYDNPILTPEKIKVIASAYTDTMYKQKVLGLWVVGDGAVFYNVPEISPDKHIDYNFISIGEDEGRVDATVLLAWGYHEPSDTWHAFDLFYNKELNGDINKLTNSIVVWLNAIRDKHSCPMRVICETNPGTMKNLIQRNANLKKGIRIEYVNKSREKTKFESKGAIQQRIDVLNMMFNMGKVVIHKKAKKYYDALLNALLDDKGQRLDDGSSDVDTLDAGEYGLKPYLKVIANKIYKEVGLC